MNKKVLIVAAKIAGIFALLLLGIWKDLMPKGELQKMTIDDIRSSRELSGVDDFRDGEWCPVCRSDNVHEIKYGTIDYVNKAIYIEAHYGSSDRSIRQFKKVGDGWKEVIPVKPMSKINEDLFPVSHLNKKKVGGKTIWYWSGRQ